MTEEDILLAELGRCSKDPVRFALFSFPWKEPGTELADFDGPDVWQLDVLRDIRDGLLTVNQAIQLAVASGHGIGKSALVAIIMIWAISTCEDTRGVVTANTENQLKTKTWAELSKWYRLFIGKHLFKLTATALFSADPEHEKTWRIDMVPWSERNTEAFAGLHNKGKRILVVFDEGSAIPDGIWETTEGALTDDDTEILWLTFGNPTRNTGRFKQCFPGGQFAHRWKTRNIDSRTVKISNKEQLNRWIKDYGEDSDFCRVRVKGMFPRSGTVQFISSEDVENCQSIETPPTSPADILVIGVDVARFGDDASVLWVRKGRDARSIPPRVLRGADTMAVAAHAAEMFWELGADAIFVDGGGVGGGVVDRLRQLSVPVIEVQFGGKADRTHTGDQGEDDGTRYGNKRAEMWGFLRSALRSGIALPEPDTELGKTLAAELIAPEYGFNVHNEIILEKKEDMKKRGLSSPDHADALALTYAYPIYPARLQQKIKGRNNSAQALIEYNPFAGAA